MKIVSLTGFGYSGSSAVKDLLKEYDDVQMIGKGEFQIFDPPDGIRDLESHINQECYYINNSIAIRRFLIFMKHNRFMNKKSQYAVSRYLNNFIVIKWRGRTGFEKGLVYGPSYVWWLIKRGIDEIYNRLFHKYSNILNTDFYLTSHNPDFDNITKEFIDEYLRCYGATDDKIVAVDQLFPGIAPTKYFKYVHDPYCIVIDRDPRDIYLEAKRLNVNLIPLDNVQNFVKYYKLTRPKMIENDRVLYLKFEDLICRYDESVKKIEKFLGIKKHHKKYQYFNPEISKSNIKLFKGYTDAEEIRIIEEELGEYLYQYNK